MEEIQRWFSMIAVTVYLILNVVFWPLVFFGIGWIIWKACTNPPALTNLYHRIAGRFTKVKKEAKEVVKDVKAVHNAPVATQGELEDYESFRKFQAMSKRQERKSPKTNGAPKKTATEQPPHPVHTV